MKRTIFNSLLFIGLLGLVLAACAVPVEAPASEGEASSDTSTATGDESTGGTMVWVGHQEVAGLSPSDAGPTVQYAVISNIHDPLVMLTPNYEIVPWLAESFEVSEDGLQYTFNLRDDVTFHDGSPFTSEDVVYSIEFYSDVETGSTLAGEYVGMESVEAPDDYTVVVNMETPNASFLAFAMTNLIVPSDYHAEVGEDVYRTQPVGTGPFSLVEWIPAEYTLLEANEDYFLGRPEADFLRQDVVPEPSVRAIGLETGEAQYATWPLLVEDSIRLRDSGEGYTVFESPANSVKHFPLNNEHPILSDVRVRQAMMFALDRQRIIDDLWNGAAVVATANLTPASPYYTDEGITTYEYDPNRAIELLEEAGWVDEDGDGIREKDGEALTFTCTTITGDQARRPIAELAQQFFAEVGIDMQLNEAPISSILDGFRSGETDCSLYNWTYGSASDPEADTLRSTGANNWSSFNNERVDELLALGLEETNPEARAQYYAEIQQIVSEEVPFLYLQFDTIFDVFRPEVTGLPDMESTINGNDLMDMAHLYGLGG